MPSFVVVEFLDERAVSVVHQSWIEETTLVSLVHVFAFRAFLWLPRSKT